MADHERVEVPRLQARAPSDDSAGCRSSRRPGSKKRVNRVRSRVPELRSRAAGTARHVGAGLVFQRDELEAAAPGHRRGELDVACAADSPESRGPTDRLGDHCRRNDVALRQADRGISGSTRARLVAGCAVAIEPRPGPDVLDRTGTSGVNSNGAVFDVVAAGDGCATARRRRRGTPLTSVPVRARRVRSDSSVCSDTPTTSITRVRSRRDEVMPGADGGAAAGCRPPRRRERSPPRRAAQEGASTAAGRPAGSAPPAADRAITIEFCASSRSSCSMPVIAVIVS